MTNNFQHDFSQLSNVGELPYSATAFDLDTLGAKISRFFKAQPEVPGIILTDRGRPVNALTQAAFLRVMSRPYGLEHFTVRPVSALVDSLKHELMLTLPLDCPIQEAVGRCLTREAAELYEPFLVQNPRDGSLRMVDFRMLLLASSQISLLRTKQLADEIAAHQQTEAALHAAKAEAEKANRVKGEFLANMSHEIRTPMNGILGMTELALDTNLSTEQREYLTLAQQSANSLLSIINDILDFSKIEAGRVVIEQIDFSLRDLVTQIIKPLGIKAAQKSLELVADVPATVPDELVGDPGRLRQVLINLLGNAVKFTERGEVALEVRIVTEKNNEISLRFAVTDTGIGIASEKQQSIFNPFVQADNSTTRRFGGTGLGLAISSGLVEQMGGLIRVESAPGMGSRFEFTIPLKRCFELSRPTPSAKPERLRGLRTLIVDDNQTNRRILEEITRHWGMIPVAVDGGAKALAEIAQAEEAGAPFGLVLLDAMMPVMDGYMVAEHLASRPQLVRATVIMLSSAALVCESERARQLGIAEVLYKPVTQCDLLKSILAILGKTAPMAGPPRPAIGSTNQALRILMAEDNPINQLLARNILVLRGHDVAMVGNGAEALAAIQKEYFDLILMDIQMPGMDGIEATTRIRDWQLIHAGHYTPIIALTARVMKEDLERYQTLGMEACIAKPFVRAEFLETIERVARMEALSISA